MMQVVQSSEIVDAKSSPSELQRYVQEAFEITKFYYPTLELESFADELAPEVTLRNRIQFYKNKEGECVGYSTMRVFDAKYKDKLCLIIWPYIFMKPEYIGNSAATWFGIFDALKTKMKYFSSNVYLFTPTSIYSYYAATKYIWTMYPRGAESKFLKSMGDFVDAMCFEFHWNNNISSNPFIVDMSMRPYHLEEKEKEKWIKAKEKKKAVEYYIDETDLDPDKAILLVAPVTFTNITLTGLNILWQRFKGCMCFCFIRQDNEAPIKRTEFMDDAKVEKNIRVNSNSGYGFFDGQNVAKSTAFDKSSDSEFLGKKNSSCCIL